MTNKSEVSVEMVEAGLNEDKRHYNSDGQRVSAIYRAMHKSRPTQPPVMDVERLEAVKDAMYRFMSDPYEVDDELAGRILEALDAISPQTQPPADMGEIPQAQGASADADRAGALRAEPSVPLSQAEPLIPCAERIVGAAICYGGIIASVPRPGRHHDVIRAWHSYTGQVTGGKCEQGFVTSDGRFVDRKLALRIADRAAQILDKQGDPFQLFSEDLW